MESCGDREKERETEAKGKICRAKDWQGGTGSSCEEVALDGFMHSRDCKEEKQWCGSV